MVFKQSSPALFLCLLWPKEDMAGIQTYVHTVNTFTVHQTSLHGLNTILIFSSYFSSRNICECKTSRTSAPPTKPQSQLQVKSRRHPGCGTESSSSHVRPPSGAVLPCVSLQTRTRKQPGPEAERGGPGGSGTAPSFVPCNWEENKFC